MLLLLATAATLLAALTAERIRLDRSRGAIPLRIAVTGTRGKTTVARLLASVLREDGRRVLAKTTGSEPCLVLPDGSVERIRRRGPASILEQKALLRRAALLRADAVVAEVMSIHAENHRVEGHRILRPHLVLATNFLVDHTEAQGHSQEDVGAVLALAIPEGAAVLVPEGASPASFRSAVEAAGGTLVEVPAGTRQGRTAAPSASPGGAPALFPTFAENLDLVTAAARWLGVGEEAVRRGIAVARRDIGALGVWRVPGDPRAAAPVHLVNAFAANDPESTARVHDRVMEMLGSSSRRGPLPCVGLLSLRADRGDRTLQWADALADGLLDRFDALLVTGLHAAALERRVRQARGRMPGRTRTAGSGSLPVRVFRRGSAERLTQTAVAELGASGGVVFGFGNISGLGVELVEHWSGTGEAVIHGD